MRFYCKEHLRHVHYSEGGPAKSLSGSTYEPTILIRTGVGNGDWKLLRIANCAALLGKQKLLQKIAGGDIPSEQESKATDKDTSRHAPASSDMCQCGTSVAWLCVRCERTERSREDSLPPKGCKQVRQVMMISKVSSKKGYVTRTQDLGNVSVRNLYERDRSLD